jgi:DNA anti-recombination protein RmuC
MSWASTELERVQAQLLASFNHTELAGESESISDGAALKELLEPYLQHFAQQQRLIESRISALRARLRASLTRASDELARLAQLDDYIERAMAAPQLRAMTGLCALLETRARRHYADDPRRWRPRLWSDLQRLLRAELDQKLQPVLGLIEALNTHRPP